MVDTRSNANASEFDSGWSREYRSGDEDVIVRSDSFRHYSSILESLCPSGDRRIEAVARGPQEPDRISAVVLVPGGGARGELAVVDQHALGGTRGSGGMDDRGRVVGPR